MALTIMVASFRTRVSDWLDNVLPAHLYGDADRAAAGPGRRRPAPGGCAAAAVPGELGVHVSEAVVSLYDAQPGSMLMLPLADTPVPARVLGVWRDFVVNLQRFHWTMQLVLPWGRLLLCAVVWLAGVAAAFSARQAAGRAGLLSVKRDGQQDSFRHGGKRLKWPQYSEFLPPFRRFSGFGKRRGQGHACPPGRPQDGRSGGACQALVRYCASSIYVETLCYPHPMSTQSIPDLHGLGEQYLHLFREGTHTQHCRQFGGALTASGARSVVWAPNARAVSVIGGFNDWQRNAHPALPHPDGSGLWELDIDGPRAGQAYKYAICTQKGVWLEEADPFARHAELPPDTAFVLWSREEHAWQDDAWMRDRTRRNALDAPMAVYELHLGSRRRDAHGQMLDYREAAVQLVQYM